MMDTVAGIEKLSELVNKAALSSDAFGRAAVMDELSASLPWVAQLYALNPVRVSAELVRLSRINGLKSRAQTLKREAKALCLVEIQQNGAAAFSAEPIKLAKIGDVIDAPPDVLSLEVPQGYVLSATGISKPKLDDIAGIVENKITHRPIFALGKYIEKATDEAWLTLTWQRSDSVWVRKPIPRAQVMKRAKLVELAAWTRP